MTIITILLAALGLTFLIFIHELGHYIVAKREGMKVEVFSIGFGPAFYHFERKGVRWQFCYILIGGYVKVSGMEREGKKEPYEIKDGFYSKSPWARIKMAAMGPIVNIVFALLAFTFIWAAGGRSKSFSEFTHLLGWVKRESPADQAGVRAGDRIISLNDKPYIGRQDLLYASVIEEPDVTVKADHIDYFQGATETPYTTTFAKGEEELSVAFMMGAADLIRFEEAKTPSLMGSGIEKGDRILWIDNQLVFSVAELLKNISENKALLTIERRGSYLLKRVPRMPLREVKLSRGQQGELDDWQHSLGLRAAVGDLRFIPYALSSSGVVESNLTFLDDDFQEVQDESLQPNDRIIAVDGEMVSSGAQILKRLQKRYVQLIVQHGQSDDPIPVTKADDYFINSVNWGAIPQIVSTIGLPYPKKEVGDIALLKPIELTTVEESTRPVMGALFAEQRVLYNPTPIKMFSDVCSDTYRTLGALVTGYLKPKYLSGPVGIVRVIQHSIHVGWKEALYFLGFISLNLGIFNLLPIPVLDGGHIVFSIIESIRKKPMKAKTMERLIIPFIVLVLLFFIFVTYQDITRIFQ
ncbi:MAG: site-2 protease family protein [Candidatus Algichlamydia australiensis]|nr:site-2 protease family protein [Chlamydiales bacterium]